MTRLLLALAVLASVPSPVVPATATSSAAATGSEPRQIADNAMKFVAAEDLKGLFEFIGRHMPMERGEIAKIRDSIIDQRKKIGGVIGKPIGVAFISECRRSEILVRLLYAEKREKNVMRWEFIFYKPRKVWTMASFHWDNNLQGLFVPCN
jgi:hypothetical protein